MNVNYECLLNWGFLWIKILCVLFVSIRFINCDLEGMFIEINV